MSEWRREWSEKETNVLLINATLFDSYTYRTTHIGCVAVSAAATPVLT